ncbi:MAG: MotA/TolQ/ExbB proton channel family protein [Planctomycetota bacterium]
MQIPWPFASRSPTAVYLDHLETSSAIRDDIVRREGMILLDHKGRRVHWLTVIGQLSPMLGLLGTVTGLVSAFHRVEMMGSRVQPSDLASGIWEALLTTVFGLVIAIPALAGRHYFQQKLDTMAQEFALLITYLDEWRSVVDRASSDPPKVDPSAIEAARKVARHA